jgi:hypothetical protein
METASKRKLGAVLAIGQGLVTAVAPRLSTRMIRQMIQGNFDNADDLVAKSGYVRRLRALGIGLAAAGVASFTMELVSENSDDDGIETATTDSDDDAVDVTVES